MTTKYQWLIFDLSGVFSQMLLQSKQPADILGKKVIPADFEDIYYEPSYKQFMLGQISFNEFISPLLQQKKPQLIPVEFAMLYQKGIKWVAGMKQLLENLSQHYQLALLTNEGLEFAQWKVSSLKIRDYFKEIFISANLGLAKPNAKIYLRVLLELETEPQQCLFIDDSQRNITAAQEIGIDSILFQDSKQLQSAFAKREVKLT